MDVGEQELEGRGGDCGGQEEDQFVWEDQGVNCMGGKDQFCSTEEGIRVYGGPVVEGEVDTVDIDLVGDSYGVICYGSNLRGSGGDCSG